MILFVILLSVQLIRRGNPENPDTDYSDYVKVEWSVKFLGTWPTVLLAYGFQFAYFPIHQYAADHVLPLNTLRCS